MKITRIDNGDGKETQHDIKEARDRLEGSGYFKEGTIDECVQAAREVGNKICCTRARFVLRTLWARWRFEL